MINPAKKAALLASRQGHRLARQTDETVRGRLTPAEIAEAERRADAFQAATSLKPR